MLHAPFPSSPMRPPVASLRFRYRGKLHHYGFTAIYAMKKMFDLVVKDHDYRWVNETTIELDDGMTIQGEGEYDLDKVIEHKYTKEERDWELPTPYPSYVAMLRGQEAVAAPTPRPTRTPRAERPAGAVTPQEVATELNMKPNKLRSILRSLNVPKPYAWSRDEADELKKKIKKSQ